MAVPKDKTGRAGAHGPDAPDGPAATPAPHASVGNTISRADADTMVTQAVADATAGAQAEIKKLQEALAGDAKGRNAIAAELEALKAECESLRQTVADQECALSDQGIIIEMRRTVPELPGSGRPFEKKAVLGRVFLEPNVKLNYLVDAVRNGIAGDRK